MIPEVLHLVRVGDDDPLEGHLQRTEQLDLSHGAPPTLTVGEQRNARHVVGLSGGGEDRRSRSVGLSPSVATLRIPARYDVRRTTGPV